jgi:hypothetical protein
MQIIELLFIQLAILTQELFDQRIGYAHKLASVQRWSVTGSTVSLKKFTHPGPMIAVVAKKQKRFIPWQLA